jgi:hypothetical protein
MRWLWRYFIKLRQLLSRAGEALPEAETDS